MGSSLDSTDALRQAFSRSNKAELEKKKYSYNGKELTEYEASQQQREIERQIRRWKREYAAMDAAGLDTSEAAGKLKQWQDEQEQFLDQTGLRRQYGREQVSGFGRSQVAKATVYSKAGSGLGQIRTGGFSGARKTPGWQSRHAEMYYEEVRNRHPFSDAKHIAKNVGVFTVEQVEEIRRHVFVNLQPRDEGLKRFDPDYDQAQAWQRLIDGKNVRRSDIVFLQHENYELTIMRNEGYNYEKAHELAAKRFDWQAALDEEG